MTDNASAVLEDLHTVRDWIRWGATEFVKAELFFGHGTDNPWDEAAQLVLWVIATPWEKLEHIVDARLTRMERQAVLEAFTKRREQRIPAPYITGIAYFAGMAFEVNEDTLIPRSPIAELIAQGFAPWLSKEPESILDLCTGSGCIGLACAAAFPDARVDLSDISVAALAVADRNIVRHGLEQQVRSVQSDLFINLPDRYSLIVSNPPYVDEIDMANLPREFRVEPVLALASGVDGLDFTRRLLAEAADHLEDEGLLVVEVGNSFIALENAFPSVPFAWLEFEQGGGGVFALTKEQLEAHHEDFRAALVDES